MRSRRIPVAKIWEILWLHLIFIPDMEPATAMPYFELLSEQQISILRQVEPSSRCCFLTECYSMLHAKTDPLLLQLRDDYVVQVDPKNNGIVSGFRCDYEINFEIGRSSPHLSNSLGAPQTITFHFKFPLNKSVTLAPQNPLQLDQFAKKLEKQYLVQLGFHESFRAVRILGRGLTATVYKALSFRDQKDVAIKSFKRAVYFETTNGRQSFQKQFKILTLISHKNLCALESVYQSPNTTYIVMENLALSLFGWIQKYGFPSLAEGKKILQQLLAGVEYLHNKKIMHRDLKLENVMVRRDARENAEIVIVDLGLAQYTYSQNFLYTRCGTPGYVAPQILKHKGQKYNEACDIFSLGAIFFILTFKKSLFEGSEVKDVIKKNTECIIDFAAPFFNSLPSSGLDLLQRMLEKDPSKRITATQALQHEYLQCANANSYTYQVNYTAESAQNMV